MNKKLIIFCCVAILLPLCSQAQDILSRRDGTVIEAKVLEVTATEIKYKNYANPDGPTYTVPVAEVASIVYSNGERENFVLVQQKPSLPAIRSERYRDLRKTYDVSGYSYHYNDRNSPGWCGVASAFIPGLGQAINNEWGRAAGFFFPNLVLNTIWMRGIWYSYRYDYNFPAEWSWGILLAALTVDIWSIVDAVQVTKVKNMYYRDLMSSRVDVSCSPTLLGFSSLDGGSQAAVGMQLSLRF